MLEISLFCKDISHSIVSEMKIRFTKHVLEKLTALRGGKITITGADIVQAVVAPDVVDTRSRAPQYIAQKGLDASSLSAAYSKAQRHMEWSR